jgi:hypothetical protein
MVSGYMQDLSKVCVMLLGVDAEDADVIKVDNTVGA